MTEKNGAQKDSVVRRAGRWSTAAAVVITEGAQHFLDPGSTVETVVQHANTGAIWGLGFQLVAMAVKAAYQALPPDGSFTVSWKVNSKGEGDAPAKGVAPPASEARMPEPVPENEKHGV